MHPLEERINYKFRNPLLLAEALTHPSLGYETQKPHFDNQRLEFLGDAVLQVIITEHLYYIFPDFSEGKLTKLRSRLVSREALKMVSQRIGLGEHIMMGRGEEANGGRKRNSILADAFEALVGAIYIDGKLEDVQEFVLREAAQDIDSIMEKPQEHNPKGQLQETLQAISPTSPCYTILDQTGPEHLKNFTAQVEWEDIILGVGKGGSKKQAETAAAAAALHNKHWEKDPRFAEAIAASSLATPSPTAEVSQEKHLGKNASENAGKSKPKPKPKTKPKPKPKAKAKAKAKTGDGRPKSKTAASTDKAQNTPHAKAGAKTD